MDVRIRVLLPIMSAEKTDVLRLRKRHLPKASREPTPEEGLRLLEAQSVRNAVMAGVIAVIVFSVLWSMLSSLIGGIYPWMTMLLGIFVGLAVRRAGAGLDWRFPLIAAVLTVAGSLIGNIVVAAALTAPLFDTSTIAILSNVTAMTWPIFFDEVMTPADLVFAGFAALLAAYYANRRLSREQYLAIRTWEDFDDQQN